MPKCLLSTVRRSRACPTVCRGDTETAGGQGSGEGSDNSDCNTCRPIRSSQRRAVKRRRSLSHLSVVTRFYLHTEQSEEGSHQDKDGNKIGTNHDGFTATAVCTSSLPTELVQTATQTKYAKHEPRSRSVKLKQLLTKRKDCKNKPSKAIQKRNKDAVQGDNRGHFSHATSFEIQDNIKQWPGAVLQPTACQQLSALPAVCTDLSEPQRCLPVTCPGPALMSAASQTVFDGLPSFSRSSLDFTLANMALPAAVTGSLNRYMKDCNKDSEHVQTTERRMPYTLTSGFLVASQLLPVAVVQPVWLQSSPMFISPCKTSPATNVFENHTVYQSVAPNFDCPQDKHNEHLLHGAEICPVSATASQSYSNTVLDQCPIRATTYVCTSSGYKSPQSQPGDYTGKPKEVSLHPLIKQNPILAKEIPPQGFWQLPFTSAVTFCTDTTGNSSINTITKAASSLVISTCESYFQANSENNIKDDAPKGRQQSELPKPDSQGGILEEWPLSISERDCCSSTDQSSYSFVSNACQSNISFPHSKNTMDCKAIETNSKPNSVSSVLLSDLNTQYLKSSAYTPIQSAFQKHGEPHCCGNKSSPGEVVVSHQPFSTSTEVSEGNIKGTHQLEIQSLPTADEAWKLCENVKGHMSIQGIETEFNNLRDYTVSGAENVGKETRTWVEEHQNSCISYQDRNTMQKDLHNIAVDKCKSVSTADYYNSSTDFQDGTFSVRASSLTKQMDSSTKKNEVSAHLQDICGTGIHSEVNIKKCDSIGRRQVCLAHAYQEFKLPNILTRQQNKISDTKSSSIMTEQKRRNYPDHLPSQRETRCCTYSSKWISAVATCISAQPSLHSILCSPVSAVLAPINHHTNASHNPVLFSAPPPADVSGKPSHTLSSSLTSFGTSSWISGSVESITTKKDCPRKNKENDPSCELVGGYVGNRVVSPKGKHAGTQVDRHSDFHQDSVHNLFSSNTRRDEPSTTHSFEKVKEFGLAASCSTCPKCSMDFLTPTDLVFHMSVHEADRQGENGGVQSQRMNKNEAETGESRNKCGVCSRVFTRSWLLKGHMRTHTGERPFRCTWPQCQRAFADKSNLRSHTLIHTTTAKSFTCPKCSRAFSQKRYLHKHMLEVCRII